MTDDRALALATDALRLWGGGKVERLIANRENAVFRVTLADGTAAALRLHRAGYQSDAAIASELGWTDGLADAGFPCPRPIPTVTGTLLGTPLTGPRASLVTWIEAPPIGAMGTRFQGPPAAHVELYFALGRLLADLHRLSDALALPDGFERPRWDIDGLTGDRPHWGRYWENPALAPAESDLLQRARDAARQTLGTRPFGTGLIHADVLQENVLGTPHALSLIDFDDGGFGFRLYDLGTAMVQHADTPHRADLGAALCDGYGGGHADLALFTLLRALASAGWVIARLPAAHPGQRTYADRALRLATAWLAQPVPFAGPASTGL